MTIGRIGLVAGAQLTPALHAVISVRKENRANDGQRDTSNNRCGSFGRSRRPIFTQAANCWFAVWLQGNN